MAAAADPEFPCSMQVYPSLSYINWPPVIASSRTINVPFPSERLASTALRTLQVDKELSPLVRRRLSVIAPPSDDGKDQGRLLKTEYEAATNRMLRVAVNSFMESLKLVLEVMEHLDVDVLEQQKLQKPLS
ncbi:unnamed protein product [Clonostachys chloroleuca]|uniref:Uncharacterized protein n=1 Tax=Clonostachys chloroleuca TaxID=1926264 RepID=A0AA35LSC7_9HYPO|nr:unnamed protein product [Clonostachys chloroleuca]